MYQALYRKYRPRSFDDVVGQQHVTETLKRQIAGGKTSHAYLFVGTRGTGKTTCAKILSRALNCTNPADGNPCNECDNCRGIENGTILDVEEIDAASNNGVDNIRALRDEAIFSPASAKKRVYIIDEVHMLSNSAFNALLKILEEPPEHLVFILATTEVRKVPATILSRCQRFSFRRITAEDIAARLRYVADKEGFTLTDGAAEALARLADGSMRDALSLLDQCASSDVIDEEKVLSAVGITGRNDTVELYRRITSGNISGTLDLFDKLYMDGKDASLIMSELSSLCRDILLFKVAPKGSEPLICGRYGKDELVALSKLRPIRALIRTLDDIQSAVGSMALSADKRTSAEICLVKLCGTNAVEDEAVVAAEYTVPAPAKATPAKPAASAPAYEPAEPQYIPDEPVPWDEPPSAAEEPAQPPVSAPKTAPAPKTEPTAADKPADGGITWSKILGKAGAALGSDYFMLSDPGISVEENGTSLICWMPNEFTAGLAEKTDTKQILTETASDILHHAVALTIKVGAPAKSANNDKLSALKRFGNVEFEGGN